MNDVPRKVLCDLVQRYGRGVATDRRVHGLLMDLCGQHRPEINILVTAQREGVPEKLAQLGQQLPAETVIAQLSRHLEAEQFIAPAAARWAVESWALALGLKFSAAPVAALAPSATPVAPSGPAGDQWTCPADGKVMARIPAGQFLYGDDKQKVTLPEYWIDLTPVTNAEYARFVAATGQAPPAHWKSKTPPKALSDHPVVNVNWAEARAYALWAGKRLPTEQQWEKAARGTDGRDYPWGNAAPTGVHANYGNSVGSTTPVGQHSPEGDSPYGCVDMAGNVWEWTASDYDNEFKVVRGGSWVNDTANLRCAYRVRLRPSNRSDARGFRCILSRPGV